MPRQNIGSLASDRRLSNATADDLVDSMLDPEFRSLAAQQDGDTGRARTPQFYARYLDSQGQEREVWGHGD